MRQYRASGKFSLIGCVPTLLLTLLGGMLWGGVLFAIDNFTNFFLELLPFITAAVAVLIVIVGVRASKCRNVFMAALVGLLVGIVIYLTYHFGLYAYNDREHALRRVDVEALTMGERIQVEWGKFTEWMEERAETGTEIAFGAFTRGIWIHGMGMWIYWGVELLGAVISSAFFGIYGFCAI